MTPYIWAERATTLPTANVTLDLSPQQTKIDSQFSHRFIQFRRCLFDRLRSFSLLPTNELKLAPTVNLIPVRCSYLCKENRLLVFAQQEYLFVHWFLFHPTTSGNQSRVLPVLYCETRLVNSNSTHSVLFGFSRRKGINLPLVMQSGAA